MLSPLVLFVIFTAATTTTFTLGQECTLDDPQSTKGRCQGIRSCRFAVNNLYADVQPKICSGKLICCPTEPTIAEKQCREWLTYLKTPMSFIHTQPLPDPVCTVTFKPKPFITHGRDAEQYEFPHAAALGYGDIPTELHYACGATLISDQYLLTAGHCVRTKRGKPTFVLLGDITLETQTSAFRQVVPIAEVIPHPEYKPPLNYNDIALVKLATKLELSRYLYPACLPRADDPSPQTDMIEAIGWGTLGPGEPQAKVLQAVNLTIFSKKECESYYSDTSDKALRYPDGLRRTQLCSGDRTNMGKDTCNGDSGGSITQNELYKGEEVRCLFRIVGITSFGSKLCGYGTPGVYTKVLSYVPWIERIVFASS